MAVNWQRAQEKAANTARSAVIMAKVRIRQVVSRTRGQLVTFTGRSGGESVGIVDILAIRKDHGPPIAGLKRGDALQIVFIQVKGGGAANPTPEDAARLRIVAKRYHACDALLATWKKGRAARFFQLRPRSGNELWVEIENLDLVFR